MGRDALTLRRILGLSYDQPPDWSALEPTFQQTDITGYTWSRAAQDIAYTLFLFKERRDAAQPGSPLRAQDIPTPEHLPLSQPPSAPPTHDSSIRLPAHPPAHSTLSDTATLPAGEFYISQDPTRIISYNRPYDIKGRPYAPHVRDLDRRRCEAMNFVMQRSVEWVVEQNAAAGDPAASFPGGSGGDLSESGEDEVHEYGQAQVEALGNARLERLEWNIMTRAERRQLWE